MAANRDARRAYAAAYRTVNRDEIRARKAAYRAVHREELAQRAAAHYAAHREVFKHRSRLYALEIGGQVIDFSNAPEQLRELARVIKEARREIRQRGGGVQA
jgi:hypothetical protein